MATQSKNTAVSRVKAQREKEEKARQTKIQKDAERRAGELPQPDLRMNATSYSDIASLLFPEFIKPKDLFDLGAFYIIGASERFSSRFNREEILFEVRVVRGGYHCALTLGANDIRRRLCMTVQKRGPVGPVRLTKIPSDDPTQSDAWGFEAADRSAAEPDASPSENDDDADDLPY